MYNLNLIKMRNYIKIKKSVRFDELKNDMSFRKRYNECVCYTLGFPYTFYCWLVRKNEIIFFKRPQCIITNPLVEICSIILPDRSTCKDVLSRVDRKMLNKLFDKKTNTIIL